MENDTTRETEEVVVAVGEPETEYQSLYLELLQEKEALEKDHLAMTRELAQLQERADTLGELLQAAEDREDARVTERNEEIEGLRATITQIVLRQGMRALHKELGISMELLVHATLCDTPQEVEDEGGLRGEDEDEWE